MKLPVKVIPGSSKDCITGWLGDRLKLRVRAPPERDKANVAVERIVAAALGIPKESVRIVRGRTSDRKVIEISGLSELQVYERLAMVAN